MSEATPRASPGTTSESSRKQHRRTSRDSASASFVAIGASAGGVVAIRKLLSLLHPGFKIPIGVVQHLPPRSRLDVNLIYGTNPSMGVAEVEDKLPVQPGCVYMAAPNYHMLVERDKSFALTQDEHVQFSRPSIDVFFDSVARVYGSRSVGVLLTGANSDGANGLKRIADAGGVAIVQDPNEAEVSVMPLAGIKAARTCKVCRIDEIAQFLNKLKAADLETFA